MCAALFALDLRGHGDSDKPEAPLTAPRICARCGGNDACHGIWFGHRWLTAMFAGNEDQSPARVATAREQGLAMRHRQRHRIRRSGIVTSPAAARPNERRSMDFVSGSVSSGKVIRMLTLVDDSKRGCPAIDIDNRWEDSACVGSWLGWPASAWSSLNLESPPRMPTQRL